MEKFCKYNFSPSWGYHTHHLNVCELVMQAYHAETHKVYFKFYHPIERMEV